MLLLFVLFFFFFFFKQKTAYEMRISDWSSDVCSSDLERRNLRLACRSLFGDAAAEQGSDGAGGQRAPGKGRKERGRFIAGRHDFVRRPGRARRRDDPPVSHSPRPARKSVVQGKSVSVRVEHGCGRILTQKKERHQRTP